MHVNSTEIQNNFGKYLMLAAKEDVIITRNGREVARLSSMEHKPSACGSIPCTVREEAPDYLLPGDYGGRKATYEEYLELTKDDEEARYEYIDGEIYLLASPKTAHQFALTELFGIFYNWFRGKKCRPMVAPYDITLRRHENDINVVQPDIMVICDLEEKLGKDDYYKGVPALIMEIISESTRSKDFVKKLNLYMYSGVEEYWVVSPINREVMIYRLKDNDIIDNRTFRAGETAVSFIFQGLTVDLGKVFR